MEKKALIATAGMAFTLGGVKKAFDTNFKKQDPLQDNLKAYRLEETFKRLELDHKQYYEKIGKNK